jgi:hypothetical protein
MAASTKLKSKGRKVGRNKKKPCQQRYVHENRRDKNKLRRAKKTANKFCKSVKIKLYGILETINPTKIKTKEKN